MATVYRVLMNFTFNNPLIAGFSEHYDFAFDSPSTDAARRTASQIVQARRLILSAGWTISRVRIGTLSAKLSAKTGKYFVAMRTLQLCPDLFGGKGILSSADSPNVAVYVKQKFANFSHTIARQLRGIPDVWWDGEVLTGNAQIIYAFLNILLATPQVELIVDKTTGSSAVFNLLCSTIERISSRRTGRPFLPLRGRRSKRKELTA